MHRVTLEPFGPFAFLVVFGHALVGAGLWWWVTQQPTEIAASPGAGLVWMSPEDFSPATAAVKAEATPSAPAAASTALSETAAEPELPKAIALTPEQALALMAAAPAAQPPTAPETKPAPVAKAEPTAPAPPAPKVDPAPPVKTPSTIITLTHAEAPPVLKPQTASLLDLATLDAQGIGSAGADQGLKFEEVDRAIIDGFKKNWLPPDATNLTADQRAVPLQVAINREGRVVSFKLLRSSGSEAMDSSVQKAADKLHKIDRVLPPGYPGERYEVQINFHVE
jgi:TonB family protein